MQTFRHLYVTDLEYINTIIRLLLCDILYSAILKHLRHMDIYTGIPLPLPLIDLYSSLYVLVLKLDNSNNTSRTRTEYSLLCKTLQTTHATPQVCPTTSLNMWKKKWCHLMSAVYNTNVCLSLASPVKGYHPTPIPFHSAIKKKTPSHWPVYKVPVTHSWI